MSLESRRVPQIDPGHEPRVWDILPHIALPLVLVLSLFCPPFRGRAAVFFTLIVLLYSACISSPWPPDEGKTRSMRYAMAGSWFFFLPVVEKLLLHVPEREFWRTDDPRSPKFRPAPAVGWGKLQWAFALVASPRGVGWNFASSRVRAKRDAERSRGLTRASFVARRLVRTVLLYLAIDIAMMSAKRAVVPERWKWDALTISRVAFLELLMAMSTYAIMSMQYEVGSAVSVALWLNHPEDWPPIWGDICDCYTVANVWGKFWHDYIHQSCLSFSHALVGLLKLRRRSTVAYLIHLITAFVISGLFHVLSISVVWPRDLPIKELVVDMALFFMAQPLAVTVEKMVIGMYARHSAVTDTAGDKSPTRDTGTPESVTILPSFRYRLLGYTWVVAWFVFSGWWFVRPYNAIGMMNWPLPFSLFGSSL